MSVTNLLFILLFATSQHWVLTLAAAVGGGQWKLLQSNIGVVAMHVQLLHNDRVIFLDRTDFGTSNLSLPDGNCRIDPDELVEKVDCTAHSLEYDVTTNTFRALTVQTDVWCSSGSATADGSLIQTGGFNDGNRGVRIFTPCSNNSCDWLELGNELDAGRWYATNQLLPDGRQIIIGGTKQFDYEFFPKSADTSNVSFLSFLFETSDQAIENNLYPFVHLNVDGNLFIFANNRAILLNYTSNEVVRNYSTIPGGDPRNYPSTGSSVLLPLKNLQATNVEAEVLICGGAPKGSFWKAQSGIFVEGLNTCGRIKITDPNPQWVTETMPHARLMSDMVLLPNGDVLIINGVASGIAWYELGRDPVLNPLIYRPDNIAGSRFEIQNPSSVPRGYHSTAILLRDTRVLVAGSNPHADYNFTAEFFPTELRVEAFHPPYLNASYTSLRPKIVSLSSQASITYSQKFTVQFNVTATLNQTEVAVTMVAPPFTSHSFSMNQRLLVIGGNTVAAIGKSVYSVEAVAPGSAVLAPPGYYLLFVVHQGIPSEGIWIHIS